MDLSLCIHVLMPSKGYFRGGVGVGGKINEPPHEISNNAVCVTSKGSDQPAHTCSLIRAFASRLNTL